jgi:sugar lactone lactonase YvrE
MIRAVLAILVLASVAVAEPPVLIYPNGLALDRDGVLHISDIGTHQIYRLNADASLTVIAGTGQPGFSGDGGSAVKARLNAPMDILFDGAGNLLVADTFNHRIRKIDAKGNITTLYGDSKTLNNPQSIALDGDGNLYIADTHNHVIRKVTREGMMSVVAGSEPGLAGDKGAATRAQLNCPQAAVVGNGHIYISDAANSRIRRVDGKGVIETIAGFGPGSGEGGAGFGGDGGPPNKARLFSPTDLKLGADGRLFIVDSGNNRVRVIGANKIVTVAGNGQAGFSGDGGKATNASLNTPQKMALAPDGTIYLSDRANHRVRRIDRKLVMTTVAGDKTPAGVIIDPALLGDKR